MGMKSPKSVRGLEDLGRARLSKSFFLRDFLFSDIAAVHGISNVPADPDLAIQAGTRLCEEILEPIQDRFGRIAIRSAYRSPAVNEFGAEHGFNCANNNSNAAGHIWDLKDENGHMGATACIVVPRFWDNFQEPGDWKKMAWWVHDHLPYSGMEFFKNYWAFNVSWHQRPARRIFNWLETPRWLTKPGMTNNEGSHESEWAGIEASFL
jgi:hypothetical protein